MIYNKENPILKEIFEKDEIKIPSKSTLHRILTNIDNNALEKVFRQYFLNCVKKENIAIDGKWLNGSDVNGQYTNECHKAILNILNKDTKIVFAHKFMAKNKANEITALKLAFNEDDHIVYKEPYSIAILKNLALNLFQLYHNKNKDKMLPTGKATMAEIKRTCKYDDNFTAGLFEQEY